MLAKSEFGLRAVVYEGSIQFSSRWLLFIDSMKIGVTFGSNPVIDGCGLVRYMVLNIGLSLAAAFFYNNSALYD